MGCHPQGGPSVAGLPADIARLRSTLPTESAALPAEVTGKPAGKSWFRRRRTAAKASKRDHRLLKLLGKPMPRWRSRGRARKEGLEAVPEEAEPAQPAARPFREKLAAVFHHGRKDEQQQDGGDGVIAAGPAPVTAAAEPPAGPDEPRIGEGGEALSSQESMMPLALQAGRDVHVQVCARSARVPCTYGIVPVLRALL